MSKNNLITPVAVWIGDMIYDEGNLIYLAEAIKNTDTSLRDCRRLAADLTEDSGWLKGNIDRLLKTGGRYAFFLILKWDFIENDPALRFIKNLEKLRGQENGHRLYKIISDDMELASWPGTQSGFGKLEEDARGLGLPCFCRTQMNVIGTKRCATLMERIMGYDLPDKSFPDYDEAMLWKIALRINRENFNKRNPRKGAIPKYGFGADGLPDL